MGYGNEERGYIRVSSVEQNEVMQRCSAMRRQNLMEADLFVDKQSGQNFDRPAYGDMLSQLVAGDVVYVLSVDRLGLKLRRNPGRVAADYQKDIGADIVVLDMPLLDTRQGKGSYGDFCGGPGAADSVFCVTQWTGEYTQTAAAGD